MKSRHVSIKSKGRAIVYGSAILALAASVILVALYGEPAPSENDSYSRAILSVLPPGWTLAETKAEQIPDGHHWDWRKKYDGPKGQLLVLTGPTDVPFAWCDYNGEWHQEFLEKESLNLWVMPPKYRDSWLSIFNPKRGPRARSIYSRKGGTVYALPSVRVTSKARFDELLRGKVRETRSSDSPASKGVLSWETWEGDLKRALEKSETKPTTGEVSRDK
jgi:hypothetical protein